ncbi:DUF4352 domain-containing protein [Listeria rocourtiae]|uniref:DUF4352 domain-containing protein n=1 Tax=Listeria rocourtiae TaxID=647910 RepID=UPI00162493DE|nr:DUF4352 domain-containing protein [Listeria rocourtiae]MBC1435167.1 DUF4352 domain-containing protein [Listeria rocourtiae]
MLKKILAITGLVLAIMTIAACTGNETPKKTEDSNHQTQEKVDAKGLEINIEQANYTDERDRDAEKVKQVLRLKMMVKNISIEEIFFDSTELQVKDNKGKQLSIYPFENMIGNIAPKKTMRGYVYFKSNDNGPYTVVYTHPITKNKYEWQVNPKK